MQLHLQGAYLHFFPDLRAYVERRLGDALARCRDAVQQVTVCLRNGPRTRSGAQWRCVVRLKVRGRAPVVAEAVRSLPSESIEEASLRLRRAVARLPARKTGRGRRSSPRVWGGRIL